MKAYPPIYAILSLLAVLATPGEAGPAGFRWTSSAPLVAPPQNGPVEYYGVKDPSVVYSGGEYHVFMTTAGATGWGLAYTHFRDWADAASATVVPPR